jgi:hypothetical protein
VPKVGNVAPNQASLAPTCSRSMQQPKQPTNNSAGQSAKAHHSKQQPNAKRMQDLSE